jgi:hypothetical protein
LHSKIYITSQDDPPEEKLKDRVYVQFTHILDRIENLRQKNAVSHTRAMFPTLSGIYLFDSMAKSLEQENRGLKLDFVVKNKIEEQINISLLLGCHLVMSHGLGFEETYLSFKPWHHLLEQHLSAHEISVKHLLRCFCCAKYLDWIDFRLSPTVGSTSQVIIDKLVQDERSVTVSSLVARQCNSIT